MRVLDLFSGLGGFSQAFLDRGHDVTRIEYDPRFAEVPRTVIADVRLLRFLGPAMMKPRTWDAVLASPPCQKFSVMTIGKNWTKDDKPKTPAAAAALELVRDTLRLIEEIDPRFWVMENPRGKLRKFFKPADTAWWCQYGTRWAKPTDLWGRLPAAMLPLKKCRNGATDHAYAPRGARTGVQGEGDFKEFPSHAKRSRARTGWIQALPGGPMKGAASALIPYGFSLALCEAIEAELKG